MATTNIEACTHYNTLNHKFPFSYFFSIFGKEEKNAIEALAEALKEYQGTLILVSHDRHFVNKMATRIIAITEKGIKDFKGSYQEYLKYYGDDYLSREWLARQE